MATLYTVLAALQEAISAVVTGLSSNGADTSGDPLTVQVGIGWPSERTLQNVVRKSAAPVALITVFDRGLASDATRWLPQRLALALTPATIQGQLSVPVLQPFAAATLTLSDAPTAGDGVALVATPVKGDPCAQVVTASGTDTPASLATQLAALLTADPDISALMTVTASGATLTLTSLSKSLIALACNIGNGGAMLTEIGRRNRGLQVVIWARTEDDRATVGDVVEGLIAEMEAADWLQFPDGTLARVKYGGDHLMDDATLADLYRRDFLLSVDYPITTNDRLFAVLAPIQRITLF